MVRVVASHGGTYACGRPKVLALSAESRPAIPYEKQLELLASIEG